MTIVDFLEQTADYWPTDKYNSALKDAETLSPDRWMNKYSNWIQSQPELSVDLYESKLLNSTKSLPERLRNSFGNTHFNPDPNWKQTVYQNEFEDVPREEFEKVLSNMRKYYSEDSTQQEKEAGKIRRTNEIKEWGLIDKLLASDYEKQRYIDNPQSAIFGKEAPGFFGSSTGAKADLISGIGAGVADVVTAPLPPVNVIAGPTIRAGRDVAHIATNSPYQKEPMDVIKDYGTDVLFNAGTVGLANARRGARILSNLSTPEVRSAYELANITDDIKRGLNKLPKASNTQEFAYAVRNLPESPLKQDLLTTFGKNGKLVDEVEANSIIRQYSRDVKPVWQNAQSMAMTGTNATMPKHSSYLTQVLTTPRPQGVYQNVEYGALRGMDKINVGWPGTILFESGRTAMSRGTKPELTKDGFNRLKEYYKATRAQDWLNFGQAMAPDKSNKAAWEAYKEVMGIE